MSITGKRRGNIHCAVIVILMLLINLMGSSKAWAVAGNYFSQNYEADGVAPDWSTGTTGRFTPVILEENGNHYLCVNQAERNNNGCVLTSTSLQGKVAAGTDFVLQFDLKISSSTNQYPVSFEIFDEANSAVMFSLTATGTWATTWIINGSSTQVTLPGSNAGNGSQTIADVTWYNVKVSRYETHTYLTITNKSTGAVVFDRSEVETKSTTGGLGKMVFTTRRYLANFALDNIVVTPYSRTYEYSKGTVADVNGTLPTGGSVEHGSKVTMPATNSILYKSGYTLTGYKSSIDNETYAFGTDVSVTDDVTFTTVFNANNVVRTDVINTVNVSWSNVALADGAAEKWYVSQSLFNGESQDVALKAEGKSITFEAVTGMKLLLPTSKADYFTSTADFDKDENIWTYTGAADNVTVTYTGDDDISETFTVTYPMTSKPVYKTNLNDEYNALYGDEVNLTVDMYNMAAGTYQWYKTATGEVADGVAIANATTATYTVPTTEHGTSYYYCIGTNSLGSLASEVAAVNVNCVPIVATDIAKDSYEVLLNDDVTMSVVVRNMTAPQSAYQWYSNTTASTEGGTAISGVNTASYTAPTTTDGTIYYYCVAENVYGKDTSKVACVTVNGKPIISNNIAKKAYALSVGDELTLAITVKNMQAVGAAYQWYVHTADTTLGTPIAGATSASYTVPTAEISNKYYYCVATNPFGSDTTIVAQVNVADYVTFDFKNWPADDVAIGVENVEKGHSGIIQSANNNIEWPMNPILYPYNMAGYFGMFANIGIVSGTGLKCTSSSGYRPIAIYDTKVGDVIVIKGQNLEATDFCPDSTVSLSVETFQEDRARADIYVNDSKTEVIAVITKAGNFTYNLRRDKSDETPNVIESIFTIDKYAPSITTDLDGQTYTIARGETKTLTVVAAKNTKSDDPLSYQWYRSDTDSIQGGTPIEGATDATYVTKENESYYYYCVIRNSVTGAAVVTTKTTHVQCKPQVKYINNAEATGEVPATENIEIGEKFTIEEKNQLLFKEGYTLTAWTDSTNTYNFGQSYDIVNDITLYPVFTANSQDLTKITRNTELTWQLGTANGAPVMAWNDGVEHPLVAQQVLSGETQDFAARVTSAGFDNTADGSCVSVADGTTIALKVKYGTIITVYAKEGETPSATVSAADYTAPIAMTASGNVLTFTYDGGMSEATLNLSSGNYEKIVVRHVPSGMPVFTANLDDNYYCEAGQSIALSIETTDNSTIQWYKNTTKSTTGGTMIVGQNSDTLTVTRNSDGSDYYYVTVTNQYGTVTSNCTQVDFFSYITLDFSNWDAEDAAVYALDEKWDIDMRGGAKACRYFYPYGMAGHIAVQGLGLRDNEPATRGFYNYDSGGRYMLLLGLKKGQHVIMRTSNDAMWFWPDGSKNADGINFINTAGTYDYTQNEDKNVSEIEVLTDGDLCMSVNRYGHIYSIKLPTKYAPVITKDLDAEYIVDKNEELVLSVESQLPSQIGGHSIAYQWYVNTSNSNKGGTAISGATAASYTIEKVDSAAFYYCLVSNAATGAITPSTPTAVGFYADLTFVNDDPLAEGEAPKAMKVKAGLPVTMPVNQTLYKPGYTLTAWRSATDTTTVGAEYTPKGDVNLYPIFTKNADLVSVAERSEAMTVTWQFGQNNGAAEYDGGVSANVQQVNIKGYDIDLGIKMTDGKNDATDDFSADGWMIAQNGTFTVPVVRKAVVSIVVYNENAITIDGNTIPYSSECGELGNVTYTYAYTGTSGTIDVNVGNNHIRSITVDYPAPPTITVDKSEVNVSISSDKVTTATATVNVTGKNLVAGSTLSIVRDVYGAKINVTPGEIIVADNGTVSQQLLISYAPTTVQESGTSVLTITNNDDASATFNVNFGRTVALGTVTAIVPVSNKTVWNWAEAPNNVTPALDSYTSFSDVALADGEQWPAGVAYQNLAGSGLMFVNSNVGAFEGGKLLFNATRKGTIEVDFSNTGANASRVLVVNGVNTSYTSSNTNKVSTAKISVEAGDVVLQGRLSGQTTGEEHLRIYKLTFTPDAETPAINVDESTSSFTLVTTDSQIEDASDPNKETIYYTLDGSDPTPSTGRVYVVGEPVRIASNCTIKAYAVATGKNNSEIAETTTDMPVYQLTVNMYPSTNGRIEISPESEDNLYTLNSTVTLKGYAKSGYGIVGWTKSRENIGYNIYESQDATCEVTIHETGNEYWAVFSNGPKGTVNYDISGAVYLTKDGTNLIDYNAQKDCDADPAKDYATQRAYWASIIADEYMSIQGYNTFKTPITSYSISAPSNYPLHTGMTLEGSAYTLQYWQDASNPEKRYELGTNTLFQNEGDVVTLIPVYKQNVKSTYLLTRQSAFTATWDFRRANGAHPFTIPSGVASRFYTTHAKMSYNDMDGKLAADQIVDIPIKLSTSDVDEIDEAISNEDMDNWCTMQRGTKVTIPSSYGTKITVATYSKMNTLAQGGTTINGVSPDNINDETIPQTEDGAYIYTWTVENNALTAELVIGSDYSYYQYITIDVPDAEHVYLDYSSNNEDMGTVTDSENAVKEELGYSFLNGGSITLTAKRKRYNELDYWIDGDGNKIYPDGTYELKSGYSGTIGTGTEINAIRYTGVTNETDSCYTLTFAITRSFQLQAVFKEKQFYTVNFEKGDAEGVGLTQQKIEFDEKFKMPDYNYNLYLAGYTLKYYVEVDAANVHYEFGHEYSATRNMRLVPVFEANEKSLTEVTSAEGVTATWRLANLAAMNLNKADGIMVTQVAIDEDNTIDVKMDITAKGASVITSGGICNVASGAVFTLPTTSNCVLTVTASAGTEFSKGDVTIAEDGNQIGQVVSVAYTGTENTRTISFAKDAQLQNVSVCYKKLATDAALSGVKIGDTALTDLQLATLKSNYTIAYDYPAASVYSAEDVLPTVSTTVTEGQTVITQATVTNPTATILLQTASGVTIQTYTVDFNIVGTVAPTMTAATVNGEAVENGTANGTHKVSGIISLTFDHAMTAANVASAELKNQTLKGTASGRTVNLTYWNLDYNKEYTLTIPAGTFTDVYGQQNESPISVTFTTDVATEVAKHVFNFVVTHRIDWDCETQTAKDTIQILPDDVIENLDSLSIPHGTLELGTDLANAAGGVDRFRIFVPDGEYSMRGNTAGRLTSIPTTKRSNTSGNWGKVGTGIGAVTIDITKFGNVYYTGRTVLSRSNVSVIGQSQDKTIIYNDPFILGTDYAATVKINANVANTYFQDITLDNRFCEYQGSNPAVGLTRDDDCGTTALYDNGFHTIFKQVTMKGYDATYSSTAHIGNANTPTSVNKTDNYYEDCSLWGANFFLHDSGQAWWENPTIVIRNRTNSAAIALPEHYSAYQDWGYVINGGRVIGENARAVSQQNNKMFLASPNRAQPAVTWLNTKFEIIPNAQGYNKVRDGQTCRLHEYNTLSASGTPLDLSQRSIAQLSPLAGSDDPILSYEMSLEYTRHNVLGGDDAYDPKDYTEQVSMANCNLINSTNEFGKTILQWRGDDKALCYFVFRLDEATGDTLFYSMTVENTYLPSEDQAGRWFVIRAANERGGLGAPSAAVQYLPLETYKVKVSQVGSNPEMGWATVCLPVNTTFDDSKGDFTVYAAISCSGSTLAMVKVKNTDGMSAGKGYVIYGKPGTYEFRGTYNSPSAISGGIYSILGGNPEDHAVSVGTLDIYTLSYKESISTEVGFYKFIGSEIPAYKAYLESSIVGAASGGISLSGGAKAAGMQFFESIEDFDEWATNIKGVAESGGDDTGDGAIYDLSGKRIDEAQMRHGVIYIINGQKIQY